jgi:hypothetical protein
MLFEALGACLQRGIHESDAVAFLASSALLVLSCVALSYGARKTFAYLLHIEQIAPRPTP